MSLIYVYLGSTFLIEQYPDGTCVLLRDGEMPFYAESLSWFDDWDEDINVDLMTPKLYQRPDIFVEPCTLPSGHTVRPVRFHSENTAEILVHRWGFVLQDPQGNVTLTNLYGEILYPITVSAYCLYDTPDYQRTAQNYFEHQTYPDCVPAFIGDALARMQWRPVVYGTPSTWQMPAALPSSMAEVPTH
ncbi:hypothetical protein [Anthocerotibacter panamensis]|uniref:hypothetical protein n=1 Tax=Anthocerotibacter panamensis TaxID=2857077 RepID=UPI001C4044C3|nr:hypothetical protein [Anthocerotibacter panamensis]